MKYTTQTIIKLFIAFNVLFFLPWVGVFLLQIIEVITLKGGVIETLFLIVYILSFVISSVKVFTERHTTIFAG